MCQFYAVLPAEGRGGRDLVDAGAGGDQSSSFRRPATLVSVGTPLLSYHRCVADVILRGTGLVGRDQSLLGALFISYFSI